MLPKTIIILRKYEIDLSPAFKIGKILNDQIFKFIYSLCKEKSTRLDWTNTKWMITYTRRVMKRPNDSLPEPIITSFMEAPTKCLRNNFMAQSRRACGSWPEKDWLLPHVNPLKGWFFGEVWANSCSIRLASLYLLNSNSVIGMRMF